MSAPLDVAQAIIDGRWPGTRKARPKPGLPPPPLQLPQEQGRVGEPDRTRGKDTVTTATAKSQVDQWKESGPVRRWRTTNGLSLNDVAGLLGVSKSSVQSYESGAVHPNRYRLEELAPLMGYKSGAALDRAWAVWWKERPTFGKS